MASNEQIRVWLAVLRGAFVAASITLLLVCVLSGVQPGWLENCYLVKIEAFPNAAKEAIRKIPGANRLIESVWDKLMAKLGVPDAVAIYATGYCIEKLTSAGEKVMQCSSEKSAGFGLAMGLRVMLALLYAMAIACLLAGVASFLVSCYKRSLSKRRHYGRTWTYISLLCSTLASLTTTATACAVYTVLSENVPESLVAVRAGGTFFALTWMACICQAVSIAIIHLEESAAGLRTLDRMICWGFRPK
ncbi:hypothetical protein DM02DRAFT_260261 [Periconia macrospinosa]|uniref:Integral membrane protein-like protein n=1 Tax=Periconia macrospinosa TaxID=97972 RepID=A0A2V1D4C8_9PLEO|nr:hypothetical protein DM02DRAFT_260261 [Periconia macrospinosa]